MTSSDFNHSPAMAMLPLRALADRPVSTTARDWLSQLRAALDDRSCARNRLCRGILTELWYTAHRNDWETAANDIRLPVATRLARAARDPWTVTPQPES